jgi:nucleoid-associated protein YgaU
VSLRVVSSADPFGRQSDVRAVRFFRSPNGIVVQSQGRRSRGERPRTESRARDDFEPRRSAGWTTDAKISAGVLGALAALCLGVVGWRFVESKYFGSTPAAGGAAASALVASPKTRTPEAIYAVPQIGRNGDDPWSPSAGASPTSVPGYAPTASANLPLSASPGAADAISAQSFDASRIVSTSRMSLPPQTPATAEMDGAGHPADAYGQTYPSVAHAADGERTSVEIRPGDSFWLISERAYGTGAYFKALYRFHEASIAEPDRLPVGQSLEIPSLETLRELFPEDVPSDTSSTEVARLRTYRTKRGDTALSVAQAELGDASRWTEVFRLNQRAVAAPDAFLPEHYELKLPPAPMMAAAPAESGRPVAPVAFPAVR